MRVRDASIPCLGLYEDSACADVTSKMDTTMQIIMFLLDCVLSRVTFYSTETLSDIVNVVSTHSLEPQAGDQRRVLVGRLQSYCASLSCCDDSEDFVTTLA